MTDQHSHADVQPYHQSLVNGALGGICLTIAGHPMDLLKVRLQTGTGNTSAITMLKQTLKQDGFYGLYRGVSAPLISSVPFCQICFVGYEIGKSIAANTTSDHPDQPLTFKQNAAAGAFSGLCSSVIVTPSDRIKTLLQIQGQSNSATHYKGALDAAQKLGLKALYRGFSATIARDLPGYATYFFVYEYTKALLGGGVGSVLSAGAAAGVMNWIVVSPMDVVKSRMQSTNEGGLLKTVEMTFRESGVKGFYRGIGPSLARAVPANAACMAGVELGKYMWRLTA